MRRKRERVILMVPLKQEAMNAALRSIEIESKAVAKVGEYLDREAFARAVAAVAAAPRIITCASGSSGAAAMKLAHSLCCVERPAKFMPPSEAVHGGLGCVQKGDALVIVSRGGKTVELLPIIRVAKEKGATLIGVTENLGSPLAASADIVLPLRIERESDRFDVMATASFMATIALFDALLCALIEQSGYRLEQFALIHPGGAVGERLNS
jgi:D-arabinose 5-phosphate isomerase GutQ